MKKHIRFDSWLSNGSHLYKYTLYKYAIIGITITSQEEEEEQEIGITVKDHFLKFHFTFGNLMMIFVVDAFIQLFLD